MSLVNIDLPSILNPHSSTFLFPSVMKVRRLIYSYIFSLSFQTQKVFDQNEALVAAKNLCESFKDKSQ